MRCPRRSEKVLIGSGDREIYKLKSFVVELADYNKKYVQADAARFLAMLERERQLYMKADKLGDGRRPTDLTGVVLLGSGTQLDITKALQMLISAGIGVQRAMPWVGKAGCRRRSSFLGR